jgi:hypothetical protein
VRHDRFDVVSEEVFRWLASGQPRTAGAGWTPEYWLETSRIAALHGIAPLLCARLKHAGTLDLVDPWFAGFLQEQYDLSAARAAVIGATRDAFLDLASGAGFTSLPLKGAALADELYQDAALRPMADLDFLVGARELEPLVALLLASGYRPQETAGDETTFRPPSTGDAIVSYSGEHPGNPISIELHTTMAFDILGQHWDITQTLLAAAHQGRLGGHPVLCLDWPAQLVMLLFHAAKHLQSCTFRAIHLWDLPLVASRLEGGDWEKVLQAARADRVERLCHVPLALAQRYFGLEVPPAVCEPLAAATPPRLKALAATALLHDFAQVGEEHMLRHDVQQRGGPTGKSLAALLRLAHKADVFRHRLAWVWPGPERRRALQHVIFPTRAELRLWYPKRVAAGGLVIARVLQWLMLAAYPLCWLVGPRSLRVFLTETLKLRLWQREQHAA